MLWRQDKGFTYELFSLDEKPENFGQFSSLITLWRSKFSNGKLPKWADFQLNDFKEWWGWLIVYDFEGDNRENIRVRLWGTKVTDFMGYDLTGELLKPTDESGIVDAQHFTTCDIEHARAAAETKQIGHLYGPVKMELKNWRYVYDIGLPLADDGYNVDKMLYGVYLVAKS